MRWDHDLVCTFYDLTQYPIPIPDRTSSFIEHTIKTNRTWLFRDTLQKVIVDNDTIIHLFEISVLYDNVEACRLLCTYPCIRLETIFNYCIYAIRENLLKVAYFMINEFPIDLEQNDNILLTTAVQHNKRHVVKHLLPKIEYPSDLHNTPLLTAIEQGNHKLVRTLLKHKNIEPHEPDNEPFRTALYNEDCWIVGQLLKDYRVRQTLTLDEEEKYLLRKIQN